MRVRLVFGIVGMLALAASGRSVAQDTPEAFVERYLDALRASEWMTVSGMMHSDVREEMHRIFQPLLTSERGDDLREELLGVRSASAASRLTAQEVLARFLQYVTLQAGNVFETAEIEILGNVAEGEDLAHVVYRMHMTIGDQPITRIDVMSLRRDAGEWRGLMRQDVSEFERLLQQMMTEQ
jgi:hypothetical protein